LFPVLVKSKSIGNGVEPSDGANVPYHPGIENGATVTVICPDPSVDGVSTDVAVTVAGPGVPLAVNKPVWSTVPNPTTLQVTAGLKPFVPLTVAVNCWVEPAATVTVCGATVTELTDGDGDGCVGPEEVDPLPHPTKNKTATRVNNFIGAFPLRMENRVPSHFGQWYLPNLISAFGIQTNVPGRDYWCVFGSLPVRRWRVHAFIEAFQDEGTGRCFKHFQ